MTVLVWDDELESTHELFREEAEEHNENEDPFEGDEARPSSPHTSISTMPLLTPPARLSFSRPKPRGAITDFPSRRLADFLKFTRLVSFSTTCSKVHPGTTGVAVLEQMERLDAVEASLKKLGSGVGNHRVHRRVFSARKPYQKGLEKNKYNVDFVPLCL